nr:hypothetical protein [Enterobacter roggenkampii]
MRNGYTSREELERWQGIIRQAAESETHDDYISRVSDKLRSTYEMQVNRAKALDRHPGLSRFTLNYMEPKLRSESDRRILASADLIKLNRTGAINKTVQRFSGWATSIPVQDYVGGGLSPSSKSGVNYNCDHIQKSALQIDFEARRVMIDQNHKLIANIDNIIAASNNAIAAEWHSHWRQAGYDYREDHKKSAIRWSISFAVTGRKNGYVKVGPSGYLDEITQPGEEVLPVLRNLSVQPPGIPEHMLTQKGQKFMASMK